MEMIQVCLSPKKVIHESIESHQIDTLPLQSGEGVGARGMSGREGKLTQSKENPWKQGDWVE